MKLKSSSQINNDRQLILIHTILCPQTPVIWVLYILYLKDFLHFIHEKIESENL